MLSDKRPLPSHVELNLQPMPPVKKSNHSGEPEEPLKPVSYSENEIKEFTNNFSKENFIGETQFGKVYRGLLKSGKPVTVKIWDEKADMYVYPFADDFDMLDDEEKFLTDPNVKDLPNLVKWIGFCRERELMAVVYDLNPLNSLHNLIVKEDFTWLQRLDVALGFACLVMKLHSFEEPYLIFNIDAAHIMLDQDSKPFLFDFGLMCGGVLGKMKRLKRRVYMSPGYLDLCFARTGLYRLTNDVFAYGVILLSLIAKRVWVKDTRCMTTVRVWATENYQDGNTLVDSSLQGHIGYSHEVGVQLTRLGMECINTVNVYERPNMDEVVKRLEFILKQ